MMALPQRYLSTSTSLLGFAAMVGKGMEKVGKFFSDPNPLFPFYLFYLIITINSHHAGKGLRPVKPAIKGLLAEKVGLVGSRFATCGDSYCGALTTPTTPLRRA
jgi:hypothetical protein